MLILLIAPSELTFNLQVKEIVKLYDENGDGVIDDQEWAKLISDYEAKKSRQSTLIMCLRLRRLPC